MFTDSSLMLAVALKLSYSKLSWLDNQTEVNRFWDIRRKMKFVDRQDQLRGSHKGAKQSDEACVEEGSIFHVYRNVRVTADTLTLKLRTFRNLIWTLIGKSIKRHE